MRPARLSIVVAIALALAAAACGTKELSRGAFIDAVNRTCEAANRLLDRVEQPPAPEGSPAPEALASYLASALTISEDAADGIRAMRAPEALRSAQEQLVVAMDEANGGLAGAVEAARSSDEAAMTEAIATMQRGRATFDSLAASMGIDDCRTLAAPA